MYLFVVTAPSLLTGVNVILWRFFYSTYFSSKWFRLFVIFRHSECKNQHISLCFDWIVVYLTRFKISVLLLNYLWVFILLFLKRAPAWHSSHNRLFTIFFVDRYDEWETNKISHQHIGSADLCHRLHCALLHINTAKESLVKSHCRWMV